jgi:hypothetical protein
MAQIFGDFVESGQHDREYLLIGFSPTSLPLRQRWCDHGLCADYLADYLCTFFPGDDAETPERSTGPRGAVAYIAHELLENAMKFNYLPSRHAVTITMQMEQSSVCFYVINSFDPQALPVFQSFIQKLLSEDPEQLYRQQMTNPGENSAGPGSRLGFLTMINQYGARLAWKFEASPEHPDLAMVTTMVLLQI